MESSNQADASAEPVSLSGVPECSAAAIEAERFAAMSQMARAMSHSARNAMQGGQACLHILGFKLADRPEFTELLDRIQASQDRLLGIFNDLIEYAGPLNLALESCDLVEILQSVWTAAIADKSQNEISFEVKTDEKPSFIRADRKLTQRAFERLLLDSREAGATTILVQIAPTSFTNPNFLTVELIDNRQKFGENECSKYFEPFASRADNLGAAFARRVIVTQGGRVSAAVGSPPGAKITITLPCS